MNETLNLHRQRTKWTADIELDKNHVPMLCLNYILNVQMNIVRKVIKSVKVVGLKERSSFVPSY